MVGVRGAGIQSPSERSPCAVASTSSACQTQTVPYSLHDPNGAERARSNGPAIDLSGFVGPTNGDGSSLILSLFENLGGKIRQMIPEQVDLVRARFTASPDSVRVTQDTTTVSFMADVPLPPPSGFRVRWDWGDGQTSENLNLTNGSHTYAVPGDYQVTTTLLSADGTRVLAVDTVQVKGDASPHWVLTSFTNDDGLDEPGSPIADFLVIAVGAPGTTMISVDPGIFNSTELRLRQLANGSWDTTNCCSILGTALPGETSYRMGVTPSVMTTVGSHFAGYDISRFSQDPNLGAGGMSGQYVFGSRSYYVYRHGQSDRTAVRPQHGRHAGWDIDDGNDHTHGLGGGQFQPSARGPGGGLPILVYGGADPVGHRAAPMDGPCPGDPRPAAVRGPFAGSAHSRALHLVFTPGYLYSRSAVSTLQP